MISRELFLTLLARAITISSGLLTAVITAHYLGPAGRGEYFYLVTLIAVLVQFCNFGLHSSNTYYVAQNKENLHKLLVNSLWISISLGLLVSTIIIVISTTCGFLKNDSGANLWFIYLLLPTTLFYLLAVNLLVGINKIKTYNLCQIASNLLIIIAIYFASILGWGVKGFLTTTSFAWIAITTCMFYILWQESNAKFFRFDIKIFVNGFHFAFKVYVICLLSYLVLKSNLFLLQHYTNSTVLGYFSIASQVTDALIILPATVGLLLFPSLVKNERDRWEEAMRATKTIALFMFGICLVTALLAKPFISFAFGKSFLPAVPTLLMILPGAFFSGITSILSQYLGAIGFPRSIIGIWLFAVALVVFLSWILIPKFADLGAALAISITYGIVFLLIYMLAHSEKKPEVQEKSLLRNI